MKHSTSLVTMCHGAVTQVVSLGLHGHIQVVFDHDLIRLITADTPGKTCWRVTSQPGKAEVTKTHVPVKK